MDDSGAQIAIFGFPASGKTNFLYALCKHSTTGEGRWSFLPHGPHTNQWYYALDDLYKGKSVPDATRVLHELAFRIKAKDRDWEFCATVWDPPGEGVKDAFFRDYDALGEEAREVVDYLRALILEASGFIVILDSEQVINDPTREAHFLQEFARLVKEGETSKERSARPCAFVFTKSDLAENPMVPPEKRREFARLRENPQEYAEQTSFAGILPSLRSDLKDFGFFAASAYGRASWVRDDGAGEGWRPAGAVAPEAVTRPLDWVMERVPMAQLTLKRRSWLREVRFWAPRLVVGAAILLVLADGALFGWGMYSSQDASRTAEERYAGLDRYLGLSRYGLFRGLAVERLRALETEQAERLLRMARDEWAGRPGEPGACSALFGTIRERLQAHLASRTETPDGARTELQGFLAAAADDVLVLVREELAREWGARPRDEGPAWVRLDALRERIRQQLEHPEGSEKARSALEELGTTAARECTADAVADLQRRWAERGALNLDRRWGLLAELAGAVEAASTTRSAWLDVAPLEQLLRGLRTEARDEFLTTARRAGSPAEYIATVRVARPGDEHLERELSSIMLADVGGLWSGYSAPEAERWREASRAEEGVRLLLERWQHLRAAAGEEWTRWAAAARTEARDRFIQGVEAVLAAKRAEIAKVSGGEATPAQARALQEALLRDLVPFRDDVLRALQLFPGDEQLQRLSDELKESLVSLERNQWETLARSEEEACGADACQRLVTLADEFARAFPDSQHQAQARAWSDAYRRLRRDLERMVTIQLPRAGWVELERAQANLPAANLLAAFKNAGGTVRAGLYALPRTERLATWLKLFPELGAGEAREAGLHGDPRVKRYDVLVGGKPRARLVWGEFAGEALAFIALHDEPRAREAQALVDSISIARQLAVLVWGADLVRPPAQLGTFYIEVTCGSGTQETNPVRPASGRVEWDGRELVMPYTPGDRLSVKLVFRPVGHDEQVFGQWTASQLEPIRAGTKTLSSTQVGGLRLELKAQ